MVRVEPVAVPALGADIAVEVVVDDPVPIEGKRLVEGELAVARLRRIDRIVEAARHDAGQQVVAQARDDQRPAGVARGGAALALRRVPAEVGVGQAVGADADPGRGVEIVDVHVGGEGRRHVGRRLAAQQIDGLSDIGGRRQDVDPVGHRAAQQPVGVHRPVSPRACVAVAREHHVGRAGKGGEQQLPLRHVDRRRAQRRQRHVGLLIAGRIVGERQRAGVEGDIDHIVGRQAGLVLAPGPVPRLHAGERIGEEADGRPRPCAPLGVGDLVDAVRGENRRPRVDQRRRADARRAANIEEGDAHPGDAGVEHLCLIDRAVGVHPQQIVVGNDAPGRTGQQA